jgi:2-polyprenyl-3-methyl-5-hydroxy-6-metoxy-1,4-benzoquinol methylase
MKEEDIRPSKIFDEYLKLTEIDTVTFFNDVDRHDIQCPACGSEGEHAFDKSGFSYSSCHDCSTLYVSPRPESSAFKHYYTEAPSVEYWATTFYKVTMDARREKLWRPKARMIHSIVKKYAKGAKVIDVGGGYGIFAEEMQKLSGASVTVIEPSPYLAESCRERGITVLEKFLESVNQNELTNGIKAFVSFELFEHLHDPALFLRQISKLMQSGDIFVFTTLSGTGVDIQGLWEDSKSVSPPHHLNFFNPHSIKILLSRIGLDCLDVTTPGKLDIDILSNSCHLIKDRFLKTFVTYATDDEKYNWQEMISKTGWSSHMMVCCQKP